MPRGRHTRRWPTTTQPQEWRGENSPWVRLRDGDVGHSSPGPLALLEVGPCPVVVAYCPPRPPVPRVVMQVSYQRLFLKGTNSQRGQLCRKPYEWSTLDLEKMTRRDDPGSNGDEEHRNRYRRRRSGNHRSRDCARPAPSVSRSIRSNRGERRCRCPSPNGTQQRRHPRRHLLQARLV